MNTRQLYWYARGYYDGRNEGVKDENLTEYPDADRQAYKDGYDRGVEDYCEMVESDPGMTPTTPFAVVCLNECGAVVPSGTTIATDELGPFVNCPECGSSFDFNAPAMEEFAV